MKTTSTSKKLLLACGIISLAIACQSKTSPTSTSVSPKASSCDTPAPKAESNNCNKCNSCDPCKKEPSPCKSQAEEVKSKGNDLQSTSREQVQQTSAAPAAAVSAVAPVAEPVKEAPVVAAAVPEIAPASEVVLSEVSSPNIESAGSPQ